MLSSHQRWCKRSVVKTGLIQHAAQPRFCYQEVHFVTKKYSFWDICFLTAPLGLATLTKALVCPRQQFHRRQNINFFLIKQKKNGLTFKM